MCVLRSGNQQDVFVRVRLLRTLRIAVNAAFRSSLRFVDWRLFTSAVLTWALITAVASGRAPASDTCVGDCPPLDQRVIVTELILGVNIALGIAPVAACPSYDVDGTGHVNVSALIVAVSNLLNGCPGGPTPPPSPTPTPMGPTARPTTVVPGASPTATATAGPGPTISFFGVASSSGFLLAPTPGAVPIYSVLNGSGFQLVIEALPGTDQRPVARNTEASNGPPDLQIQATRSLGDGSPAVCDDTKPIGGVPGVDPPQLGNPNAIADQLNDFGCRFIDGMGAKVGRTCIQSCILPTNTDYQCESDQRAVQFCAQIYSALTFPQGDTLLTVQVRNTAGDLGPPAQLILHVVNP
jgi:hypothetical protein